VVEWKEENLTFFIPLSAQSTYGKESKFLAKHLLSFEERKKSSFKKTTNFVDSIPRRVNAVIASRGNLTMHYKMLILV